MFGSLAGDLGVQSIFQKRSVGHTGIEAVSLGAERGELVDHLVMRFGVQPRWAADVADDVLKIIADPGIDNLAGMADQACCGNA